MGKCENIWARRVVQFNDQKCIKEKMFVPFLCCISMFYQYYLAALRIFGTRNYQGVNLEVLFTNRIYMPLGLMPETSACIMATFHLFCPGYTTTTTTCNNYKNNNNKLLKFGIHIKNKVLFNQTIKL